jgi:hypothetical protein
MVVTLSRRINGAWVRIGVRRPLLSRGVDIDHDKIRESRFSTQFPEPRPGRCRIVARFPGDADHGPSQATKLFPC